ncbi:MAG: HEAT repeat domain-containing protein, partial [Acidobacteriota bacterium]|nr:HEAT repeat domain-containing protein [Acidobacteriota bacterium]
AQGLRRAIARAESEAGKFAAAQKEWAVYGLAILGDPEAVGLLESGRHLVGGHAFMDQLTLIEAVAVLTAPDSLPVLVEHLNAYAESEEEDADERIEVILKGLVRVADPSARAAVLPHLESENWRIRRQAIYFLAALQNAEADADYFFKALSDPEDRVKRAGAEAILAVKPVDKINAILTHLETEEYVGVRVYLYRALAAMQGEKALEALRTHWGSASYLDRMWVIDSVGRVRSPKGLNLLRTALKDRDRSVAIRAIDAMRAIDTPGARETLLALIGVEDFTVARPAIDALTGLDEARAAPRIADRLLRAELADEIEDPVHRDHVRIMGNSLVELGYAEPRADLAEAAKRQTDLDIVAYLETLDRLLGEIETRGKDVAKWTEAMASHDRDLRRLAYTRLRQDGGSAAVAALAGAFDNADDEDRVQILAALARIGGGEAAPLLERVLLDPQYDAHHRQDVRSAAAWAARNVGGPSMALALRRAAERRDGQDIWVLVYLAVLTGPESLPVLQGYRGPRLAYFSVHRGFEMDRLDWMIAELEAGRSIASLDKPPTPSEN